MWCLVKDWERWIWGVVILDVCFSLVIRLSFLGRENVMAKPPELFKSERLV
jgi:hypothetical protein